MEVQHVLLAPEAECYVQALEAVDLTNIGGAKWQQQHEYMEKLNMQAVVSASQQEDEFVKEFLISHEKIPLLIQDLITTEIWKRNVFPELIRNEKKLKVTFPIYMVLYHEATVTNLLETCMYHKETAESAEDSILDLLEYCYRKLVFLVDKQDSSGYEDEEVNENLSPAEELEQQRDKLEFDICVKVLSLVRYITDHLSSLPLTIMSRMLNTHDVPLLLVQLLDIQPWTRSSGQQKYIDNKWTTISPDDWLKITKIEGQVWLALYSLLMSPDCQQKYEFNPYRKNMLLKVRSQLTEVVLDQLPVLADLRYYLEQLSMMEPPPPKSDLILEQVPEISDHILKAYDGQWKKIAKKQLKEFFNSKSADVRAQAERLASTYNMDNLEALIAEPPTCVLCGAPAAKRCSRCQNEWYCRRECQVNHWKKHKKACDLFIDSLERIKKTDTTS